MSTEQDDTADYAERASSRAVAGAAESLSLLGGRLVGSERWVDDDGHWLRVRGVLDARPAIEVHYARVVLPAAGPDKDPETEAIVYSSGFEELLHTRSHALSPVDGVITL